jgi:hypothetical protein
MRHHSAGAPALLTPLQRADNLLDNTMNRRSQVLVKEARSTEADDDVAIGEWAIGVGIPLTFLRRRSPRPTSALVRITDSTRTSS